MKTKPGEKTYLDTVGELIEFFKGLPDETPIRAKDEVNIRIKDDGNGAFIFD